jgi:hypothetical protein
MGMVTDSFQLVIRNARQPSKVWPFLPQFSRQRTGRQFPAPGRYRLSEVFPQCKELQGFACVFTQWRQTVGLKT